MGVTEPKGKGVLNLLLEDKRIVIIEELAVCGRNLMDKWFVRDKQ